MSDCIKITLAGKQKNCLNGSMEQKNLATRHCLDNKHSENVTKLRKIILGDKTVISKFDDCFV